MFIIPVVLSELYFQQSMMAVLKNGLVLKFVLVLLSVSDKNYVKGLEVSEIESSINAIF